MPPGGGSNFSFGVGESQAQPVRKHKMASNIFGVVDDEPAPTKQAQETGTPDACGELDSAAEWTCQSEDCSNASGNMDEMAMPETESGKEQSQVAGEPAQPAQPAAAPSRRNPPGGRSTLVLG
ncbi:hypothetical protein XENTR_v10004360 [Xenopus tropicalis]|nr:hypothetical protein XENTR_v10004360 [Xenopus tropicalis]